MRAMWETAKMSYCSSGCLFMSRWNMMYLQKEYTIHLAVVSHAPATPSGVSNIVKTESSPQMIYTPIVRFVFLANISDLLCLSRGELEFCGCSALSEWVTLKAVWKDLRVTLWTGWACDWEPTTLVFANTPLTDGVNHITALALSVCYDREQQLNRHNILPGINVNVRSVLTVQQHRCQQHCVEIYP